MDVCETLQAILEDEDPTPQAISDSLLNTALHLDDQRPSDDISVVTLKTTSAETDGVRRMTVSLPCQSRRLNARQEGHNDAHDKDRDRWSMRSGKNLPG